MSILIPSAAIKLLESQIQRGNEILASIDHEKHSIWEDGIIECLKSSFGTDSGKAERFCAIGNYGFALDDTDWNARAKETLPKQLAFLKTSLDILRAETFGAQPVASNEKVPTKVAFDGDPLKRRYQVFVSSTYEDLIEERRRVMHALLETMCIPTGMELFPAASEEQWNLIKRIIEDCDYYIVIVAGRYGSIGPDGKSYTEAEYDYAVSRNKSVMGFFHSDVANLPSKKCEKKDDGQQKLAAFNQKVKSRICKGWTTAEGLESAVKSAILNAIQFDPKPGWVRATDIASASAIANFKNSVQQQQKRPSKFLWWEELIQFPVTITFWERETSTQDAPFHRDWKSKEIQMNASRKELFMMLGERLSDKRQWRGLKMFLERQVLPNAEIKSSNESIKIVKSGCEISPDDFSRILDMFLARGLIKRVNPPRNVTNNAKYFNITQKGLRQLAELREFETYTAVG